MKDKFIINEEKKQNIYCVLFVLVLILLAFGDQIALHFLEKNPNPNNSVFGESKEKDSYKIDFMQNLDIEEILKKMNNQESFLLLSSRDSCQTCDMYLPVLKEIYDVYKINGFYFNRDLYDTNSKDFQKLQSKSKLLDEHLIYTPYLMYFENGDLKDELVGRKEKNEVEDFVIRNKLANK